ncbi:MAG: choice-of-anchor A family protein [Planctomycetes bacterium]|nr:choice-of-anchor A family protein [Planctomycetota bacterium]
MKCTVPPRLWCGALPALIALTLPASAQLGGIKVPGKHNQSPAGGSMALGVGCGGGDTSGLLIPLNETFDVVPMDDSNGVCFRNDDGSTVELPLQFDFEFFGETHTGVHINNNGNLSFGSPFYTYSSAGFPVDGYPMIAPFWGDVDTQSSDDGAGVVYYRSEPNRFVVTWDHVGYYDGATDKQNTFQVILTDGSDPLIGLGNNVCFSWADMQWTTGDASYGEGGFSGVPATVGANKGDGEEYFLVGRFDHPGEDYDGPGGVNDGVDYLDNRVVAFSTGVENIPPIIVDAPDGCVSGMAGEPISMSFTVIAPEEDQGVGGFNDFYPEGWDVETSVGEGGSMTVNITWNTTAYDAGEYRFTYVARDTGDPPLTTSFEVCFSVESSTPEGVLGEAGQFNVYSTRQLTINNASIAGRIGAEKNLFISEASIASGDVPADVDSMASGRAVWAENGVLNNGNIVAELHLDHLEDSFSLANSTQEPRVDEDAWDHEAMSADLFALSATYGAMLPTGSVTEDGYGNLTMSGTGSNPEIFLVTDSQLEEASHVTVSADPDVNVLINVEGGRVSPSSFGFEVQGTSANRVLMNFFEAWQIDFSETDLNASLLAPESEAYVSNISVSGNIVARWIELLHMDAAGDLLIGSYPSTTEFTYSMPMQAMRDTLKHNLVLRPLEPGHNLKLGRHNQALGDSIKVKFANGASRDYRADKVAMITIGNGMTSDEVTIEGALEVPIHYLEDGPLGGDDLFSLSREGADLTRPGVLPLELLNNDLAGTMGLNVSSLRIVNPPQHGVVRRISGTSMVWYAWSADKDWENDRFQYVVQDNDGNTSKRVEVLIVR